MNLSPGTRVRYTGQATNRDCDATLAWREWGPGCPERLALRLDNGAVILVDPADCRPLGAVITWPRAFAR